ncbi:MAG: ribonuclease R, partial [Lentilactobacillus hilgardii]
MQDNDLKTEIENVLRTYPDNEFSVEKIADVLRYHGSESFKLIVQELAGLERDGIAVVTQDGKFQMNPDKQKLSGIFHANDKGFGFVAYDDIAPDAYIAPDNTMNALNGDTVEMEIVKPAEPGSDRGPEGKVTSITDRKYKR